MSADRRKGDFPRDIPTQEEFENLFTDPVSFGEEGEHLLVSKRYSQEEALAKIQEFLRTEWGWSGGPDGETFFPKSVDDLCSYDVGWGYDPDSYHYSEGCWWICYDSNEVSKRFEAWGVETQ